MLFNNNNYQYQEEVGSSKLVCIQSSDFEIGKSPETLFPEEPDYVKIKEKFQSKMNDNFRNQSYGLTLRPSG